MLATPTALVLALTLGVAPGPVPHAPAPTTQALPAEAPPAEAPPTEAPPTEPPEAPPAEAPPAEAPPAEAPPAEAPPAQAPPAQAPPAQAPPADDDDPFGDQADQEPWPDDEPEADVDAEPLPDYDPLRDSPQALRARHWVRTGIGTLAAGGALLIGAIIVGASDPCYRPAGNSCQVEARNRAALVMGVPAAILVGGGAAMLGVGLTRQRRLAIDLQASLTSLGVRVRGRF